MSTARGANDSAARRTTIITPETSWLRLGLRELWEQRELLRVLAGRDVRIRYKQTLLGVIWAVLQPGLQLVLFTVIFGRLARMPSDGVPYALFACAGLLPWALFSGVLGRVTNSVVGAGHLIKHVRLPHLVVPVAAAVSPLLDFAISLAVLVGLMIYYGVVPGWALIALPGFVALAWLAALGVGLWLAAVNVHYRDVGYTFPFVTQLWMFATPIVYPASLFPQWARPWLGLNPIAGVVEGFRWSMLGHASRPGPELLVSVGVTLLLLLSGTLFFRKMERSFADVV